MQTGYGNGLFAPEILEDRNFKVALTPIGIQLSRKSLEPNGLIKKLSPLGDFESHNVIISLKKERELVGLYGLKKRFKILAFNIDKPKEFKERLESLLQ